MATHWHFEMKYGAELDVGSSKEDQWKTSVDWPTERGLPKSVNHQVESGAVLMTLVEPGSEESG